MKTMVTFVLLFMFCGFASNAATEAKMVAERYLLKNNPTVHISVETGWQRDGIIPVQLKIQGLSLTLWMDGEGRVFDDFQHGFAKTGEKLDLRQELFRLDKANGQIQSGGHTLKGQVYEQDPLRTRLRLDNLPLALELDIQKSRAVLDLNGIVIPARLRLGKESDGMRELKIGAIGNRGRGQLLMDAQHGKLIWQDKLAKLDLEKHQSGRACWAEKQE